MKTIKELRAADALKLAERLNPDPTPAEIETATKAMRAYYRFCAAYQASFYTEQSRDASEAEKAAADLKSERAYKRATDALKPYKLKIDVPGLYPIIDNLSGSNFTYGHFYH